MIRPSRDSQMYVMAAFGFAAGLPLPLSGITLRQWLTEGETSLAAIGFTASIGLAYSLKFLWSPVLDQVTPSRFGRRRGWLLLIQPAMILATLALAVSDPIRAPYALVAAAITIAFLSASQDVVIDAWRIETFPEQVQGVALAAYIWGYRAALLISGAGALKLVDWVGWHWSITAMAALMGVGIAATLLAREPLVAVAAIGAGLGARLRASVIEPFVDFLHRPGAAPILAFIMLFKLGEALAHTMAVPFYRDMGFVRADIAFATGIPGLVASLLGAAAGGWLVIRIGTGRALVTTGFVQMASMGLYFALAVSGGDVRILLAKIMLENFAEAMADAAFITYLSSLCSTRFTATQYALLSSLATVGLRTLGGTSGLLAGSMGWVEFYAVTIFAAVPAMLIMLFLLRRYPPVPPAARPREATP
jgi:PAT family beta-lactamase induction signal transducer AmpG